MNRAAFTLIEVLIAVLLLFITGSALFKFNGVIKKQIEHDIDKHKLALISSIVAGEKKYSKNKTYTLDYFVKFDSIHDDDMRYLKDHKLNIESTEETPYFLYSDGEKDFEVEYGYHYVSDEKAKERVLWINR